MADYESAAYTSLEKLKEKHDGELQRVGEEMRKRWPCKYTLSKELMEMRGLERKHLALREYEKAESLKRQADKMEQGERHKAEREQDERVAREEGKLRTKQQA